MKVIALVNVGAGSLKGQDADAFRLSLASAFERHGIEAKLEFVEGDEIRPFAERALADARRGETDAIVVGGGDGTIRTVAGIFADTGLPVGLLPLGTLNHFA